MKLFLWKSSSKSELGPRGEIRFEQDWIKGSKLSMSGFFLGWLAFLDRSCDPCGIDDLPGGRMVETPMLKADWLMLSATGVKLAFIPSVTDLFCDGRPA